MRFLQSEYKPVIAAIQSAGYHEADFSFVKKRGRLHINHLGKKVTFHFFRRTETILTEDKKWEKAIFYFFSREKEEELAAENWEKVLKEFTLWLKHI